MLFRLPSLNLESLIPLVILVFPLQKERFKVHRWRWREQKEPGWNPLRQEGSTPLELLLPVGDLHPFMAQEVPKLLDEDNLKMSRKV
jgi:hypothetical protein